MRQLASDLASILRQLPFVVHEIVYRPSVPDSLQYFSPRTDDDLFKLYTTLVLINHI